MSTSKTMTNQLTGMRQMVIATSVLAGILYNSWPLGYWLDPDVASGRLASDLEFAGHPYYWLFLLGDVLTGVFVIVASLLVVTQLKRRYLSRALLLTLGGFACFGIFTIVAAFSSSQCVVTLTLRCKDSGYGLSPDAITSGLAALGLFTGLAGGIILTKKSQILKQLTCLVLIAWALSGLLFSYLALSHHDAHFTQQVLMILSGVAAAIIGIDIASAVAN